MFSHESKTENVEQFTFQRIVEPECTLSSVEDIWIYFRIVYVMEMRPGHNELLLTVKKKFGFKQKVLGVASVPISLKIRSFILRCCFRIIEWPAAYEMKDLILMRL